MYILSKYNYIKTLKNQRTLIWNTYTGSLFVLERHEFEELKQLDGESFNANFHYYIDSGILVAEQECDNQLSVIKKIRKETFSAQNEINFRVLPTTACNARCAYCYEKNIRTITMKDSDADAIAKFISRSSNPFSRINISWFGGEPLLFPDRISYITQRLVKENPNKELYFDITSNGILFDEHMVEIAANEWHISEVQISMDGTKEIYEATKNYVDVTQAYETILRNISFLIKKRIKVFIRLNVNKKNHDDLIKLIHQLHKVYANDIEVYAYPIFNTDFYNEDVMKYNEMVSYMGDILLALKECGYIERIITFKESILCACTSILPNNFVIMPNGDLLKCSSEIGQDNCIGNVRTGVINIKRNNDWSNYELDTECEDCCFLPVCQGGCIASKFCKSSTHRCCLEKYLLDGLIDRFYEEIDM